MPEPEPKALRWGDLAEGMAGVVEFTVTEAEMRAFAALSGDHNALHRDDAFARGKGFEGRLVYGGLLVAKVSRLIGMELPGADGLWTGLSLRFLKPLYVGEAARLEGTVAHLSPATRNVTLKLAVRSAGRLIAKGTAEVLLGAS